MRRTEPAISTIGGPTPYSGTPECGNCTIAHAAKNPIGVTVYNRRRREVLIGSAGIDQDKQLARHHQRTIRVIGHTRTTLDLSGDLPTKEKHSPYNGRLPHTDRNSLR